MNATTNETAAQLQAQIKALYTRNGEITKAGGFFTAEQIENGNKIHKMRMTLRFNHGIES